MLLRSGKWGPERLSDLPEVTSSDRGTRAGFWVSDKLLSFPWPAEDRAGALHSGATGCEVHSLDTTFSCSCFWHFYNSLIYHLSPVAFSVLQTELIVPLADSTGCHLSSSMCHITQSQFHGSVCPQARDQSLPLSASPEFSIATHTMDGVPCIGNCWESLTNSVYKHRSRETKLSGEEQILIAFRYS